MFEAELSEAVGFQILVGTTIEAADRTSRRITGLWDAAEAPGLKPTTLETRMKLDTISLLWRIPKV
jgi:hypothetical protein